MKDNECRIIKIEKDALFEFIYENFIANHEELMDLDAVGCMNTFAIDWEAGEFIFCAHKDENEHGDIVPFPKDIDVVEKFVKMWYNTFACERQIVVCGGVWMCGIATDL